MARFLTALVISGFLGICLGADTITLKDGQIVKGSVLRFEKGKFTVDEGGEKPRIVRVTDIDAVDFEQAAGGVARKAEAPKDAAAQQLQGDELDAWKLARSHIATNHETWMPDNAMPVRDALQVTADPLPKS